MYFYNLLDDGQMNDCDIMQGNNNKRMYCVWVLCLCGFNCYCLTSTRGDVGQNHGCNIRIFNEQ